MHHTVIAATGYTVGCVGSTGIVSVVVAVACALDGAAWQAH